MNPKSLNYTIEKLKHCSTMGIFIFFDQKLGGTVVECRSIFGGEEMTNSVLIPEEPRRLHPVDVVDFEASKLLTQAIRQNPSGRN